MTAEESIKELVEIYGLNSTFQDEIKEIMIKFAQYHVEQALKKASNDATTYTQPGPGHIEYVDKYSILRAYPKENIK